uniref:Uncharacterized protein n=1 Tax=Oryza nivara TaxID=4536 RepID=A0A0E0J545_ORYNI
MRRSCSRAWRATFQFIKDEMDSMNGFLMHLTKTTTTNHDDQVRAWMKQVRDIAYVADDNIKLYMRDLVPPEKGSLAWLRHRPKYILTIRTRCRVAKDIKELKERVREVGKRRLRYGVDLPKAGDAVPPPPSDQDDDDKMREDFRRALLDEPPEQPASFVIRWAKKAAAAVAPPLSPIENTINKINCSDAAIKEALKDYFLKKPVAADDDVATSAMKMLLCTLYAYPYRANKKAVDDLLKKLEENKGRRATWDVMLFSYSMLSTPYKSCLQYLTTFNKEKSISRTCLVRRWVAEGLLDAAATGGGRGTGVGEGISLEEAGECCFAELVFLGFLSPAAPAAPTGLKLKSCVVPDGVKEFISSMSKNENFVSNLPTHLQHQVEIRRFAGQDLPPTLLILQQQRRPWRRRLPTVCGPMALDDDGRKVVHPMDQMVHQVLEKLPQEYRLNVIDLGGCQTLRTCHLKKICELVPSLRYLSLRKTNVHRLPKQMRDLLHLETLDIRDTNVLPATLRHIVLNDLKHLLAGVVSTDAIATVFVPRRIGLKAEVLKHVQIQDGGDELVRVGALEQLRKLGVVLDGREDNMARLYRVIGRRSDTLRSLSVWITAPSMAAGNGGFVTLGSKRDDDDDGNNTGSGAPSSVVLPEKLESLNLKCFKGNKFKPAGYSIPHCIQGHQYLSKITLRHSLLNKEGLRELGKLKSLRCLKLRHESYMEAEVTLSEGEFLDLRLLVLDQVSVKMTKLVFEARAAPKLEKIVWNLDKTTTSVKIAADNISGIDNLTGLKELKINDVAYPKPFPFSTTSPASK